PNREVQRHDAAARNIGGIGITVSETLEGIVNHGPSCDCDVGKQHDRDFKTEQR
ncbi:hypothetical protein A2U01_0050668, partial [Trifolium medium]|nr:hypothetical protein [Trifolium medium]